MNFMAHISNLINLLQNSSAQLAIMIFRRRMSKVEALEIYLSVLARFNLTIASMVNLFNGLIEPRQYRAPSYLSSYNSQHLFWFSYTHLISVIYFHDLDHTSLKKRNIIRTQYICLVTIKNLTLALIFTIFLIVTWTDLKNIKDLY